MSSVELGKSRKFREMAHTERFPRVAISVYGGIFILETSETAESDFAISQIARKTTGFVLGESKEQPPSNQLTLIGAEIQISAEPITAKLPEREKRELINELNQVLSKGTLTPAQSAELRGRLRYSQSLLFGRFGRARITDFTA